MATTIQEPNDIDASEITTETIGNFAMIMYEKSQTTAGLKQLALASLKDFLGYEGYKSDNIATLIGFEKDSGTDSTKYDYNGEISAPDETLLEQLQAVADQAGVTIHPSSGITPLSEKIESNKNNISTLQTTVGDSESGLVKEVADINTEIGDEETSDSIKGKINTLEDYVKDGWTDSETSKTYEGLLDRVKDAENNISSLEEEIGSGTGSQSLTERISNVEDNISTLQTTVGDSESGLVKEVADINTEIGDEETSDSIKGKIKTNEDNISTLQTTVGNSENGLVKDVADINTEIGDEETEGTLTYRIKTNENDIESIKESIGSVYKLKGNVSSDTYSSWISGIADFENGWVWNATDSFEITVNKSDSSTYTIKVNTGENFAFVADTDNYEYGYFDQLGTTIDISELQSEIDELNITINDENTGLIKSISDINTEIGDEETSDSIKGKIKTNEDNISTLQTTVGDETSGLIKEVADINTEIGDEETSDSIKGKIKTNEDNISTLQTTVGNSENGLVKDVNDLQTTVGDGTSGLVNNVNTLNARFSKSASGTWNSSAAITESGTYIICGSPNIGGTNTNIIFMGTFNNNGSLETASVIDMSGNFETYFTIINGVITSNQSMPLNSFRIGG